MKRFFALLILTLTSATSFSQDTIELQYNADFTATLNGTSINNETTYQEIVALLGEPEVYKTYPTGKTNYRYSKLGLVFHTVNDKLLTMAFNFNWDGDKNFPDSPFKGNLKIGDSLIDQKTTEEVVNALENFEIKCIMPGMCMNNPNEIRNPIVLHFKDNLITQVSIEFH